MAYGPTSIGGYMALSPATKEDIGGVKIGDGINVAEDGTISINVSVDTVFPVGSIYLSKITLVPPLCSAAHGSKLRRIEPLWVHPAPT